MANTNFIGFVLSFIIVVVLGISMYWGVTDKEMVTETKNITTTEYHDVNTTVTEQNIQVTNRVQAKSPFFGEAGSLDPVDLIPGAFDS